MFVTYWSGSLFRFSKRHTMLTKDRKPREDEDGNQGTGYWLQVWLFRDHILLRQQFVKTVSSI